MEKLLAKIGIKGNLRKNFAAILIIACSGMIIYGLPYFRLDYYDAYVATYNLTDIQMGLLGSVYGAFGMISYLFGGVLADRVPTRVLLTYLWWAQVPADLCICCRCLIRCLSACMLFGDFLHCSHFGRHV